MNRRTACAWMLAGLAVHALLLAGALQALPVTVRIVLAAAALVLAPGFGLLALTGGPPGGAGLAPGWALGFGVAWQGAWIMATVALRLPFTVLERGALVTGALLAVGVLATGRARPVGGAPPAGDGAIARRWGRRSAVALAAACALGIWSAARFGAPLSFFSDSPDHVATVRRMAETGVAFPGDAFFKDAGRSGLDPRKSLWHPEVALVTRLARADAVDTWRWLPLLLVPLFVLNAASLGFLLRGPPGAAIAAWALVLTYGGSFGEQYLREAVFATKLGDQLALATAVALLADLDRRTRGSRAAAVLLALGAVAAHVYYILPFAFGFGGLALAAAIQDRGLAPRARRIAVTAVALGLACLPYLLWRAGQAYAPRNEIHTAPQGLLTLWDHVRVMNVGILWDWYGLPWVILPFAAPALWRAGRTSTAALHLAVNIGVVAACLFLPPVTGLLQPRLGYLLLRMVWMVPLAGVIAWALPGLIARLAGGARARVTAAAGLAGMLFLLLPALEEAAGTLAHPERLARLEHEWSAEPWWDALTWMRHALPRGTVVLTDPITAYTIPMATGHFVTTLLDQHSSPNDERALDRIYDARDALDPFSSWERTRAVVRRYGVTTIALNDRFLARPVLTYWGPRHSWFQAARARFDRAPGVFVPRYDTGNFVVYEVRPRALDTLALAVPPPASVHPWDPAAEPDGRAMGRGMPLLLASSFAPRVTAPGDTMHAVLRWRAPAPLARGSYLVSVRFDRALPGGFTPPRWCAKPFRKLVEKVHGERYRFRTDHLPAGGDHGVDLWRPDQVVADSFTFTVPPDVAAGAWRVSVRIQAQAPYPNYRLSDYFMDEDYYAGVPVDTVRIRDGGAPGEGGH